MNRPPIEDYMGSDGLIAHTDFKTFRNTDDALHRTGMYYGFKELRGEMTQVDRDRWAATLGRMYDSETGLYARDTTGSPRLVSRDQYWGGIFGGIALRNDSVYLENLRQYFSLSFFINKDVITKAIRVARMRACDETFLNDWAEGSDWWLGFWSKLVKHWSTETSNRMNRILYAVLAYYAPTNHSDELIMSIREDAELNFGSVRGVFDTYFRREQDPSFGDYVAPVLDEIFYS